ncbi:ABC transporter substrate-binding protein [Nocardioides cynanchi]|uniref:ABC transporter substrate-binding protein n=1 Tax=Nocardioides cynanchi TaxID=2558918 RepID=UPI001248C963|nr:ABC transporter substrate-binding protein [Nocardioides cynanchi]
MQLRFLAGAAATTCAAVVLAGCGSGTSSTATGGTSTPPASSSKGTVTISGQNFTEAEIVADMYAGVLAKAGYTPKVKLVGTRDIYMKVFPKSVDVVPEYVGGILEFLNGTYNGAGASPVTLSDAAKSISDSQSLLKKAKITLLNPSPATDSNAFFVSKDYADQNNVSTLSDLKGKSVVLAAAPDCKGRLDCEGGLSSKYGIDITKILPLGYASQQTYDSVLHGESQLGETSTTDGTLDSQGLVLLTDDLKIQPAENLVPAVSASFLAAHPDVAKPLNDLMAALTTAKLTELNAKVAVDREKPQDVADQFLSDAGLS